MDIEAYTDIDIFINDINLLIYNKFNIYRTILVIDNDDLINDYYIKLSNSDHNIIIFNNEILKNKIDLNNIDYRILLINRKKFKELINYIYYNFDIINSSFNLIAFDYSIDNYVVDELKKFYCNKTKNNINNTIIFDKKYIF